MVADPPLWVECGVWPLRVSAAPPEELNKVEMAAAVRVCVPQADAARVDARVQEMLAVVDAAVQRSTATDNGEEWVFTNASTAEKHADQRVWTLSTACFLYWTLADVQGLSVAISDANDATWTSLNAILNLETTGEEAPPRVRALDASEAAELIADGEIQIVDCRPQDDFYGMNDQSSVSGHLDNAISIPFVSVFQEDQSSFLTHEELVELLESAQVDFMKDLVVVGSCAVEAAAVATVAMLAGHKGASFSITTLTQSFVDGLPQSTRSGIFDAKEVLFVEEDGDFDLSPSAASPAKEDVETSKDVVKEYDEFLKNPVKDKTDDEDDDEPQAREEIVWVSEIGHRYFDMPHPVDKHLFVATSRDIYRVVSFVLAPFGFPSTLQERFTVSEVKARCSSLYQDVIEVCSDLVYHHRDLNEGAMAMSVHKWVEEKRDPLCSEQVRKINELVDTLYAPPRFVEVPDLSESRVMEITEELHTRLLEAARKRAAWAFDVAAENEEDEDVEETKDTGFSGWGQSFYPSVVYTLGFLPQEPSSNHKKLSTLQIKTFIQVVAEAAWGVIESESLTQVEFQALCDTLVADNREVIAKIKESAEKALYVVKHSLTQSMEREEDLEAQLLAVQRATDEGERAVRSGRHQVALATFANAFKHLPIFHKETAPLLVGRANTFIKIGELGRAREVVQVLLKLDPFSCGAYGCLGEIEEKQNQPDSAMQHYVTAFILDGSRSPERAADIDRVARLVGRNVARNIFKAMVLQHELPTQWLVESYFDSFEHDVDNALRIPIEVEKMANTDASELTGDQLVQRAFFLKRKKQYRASQADVRAALDRPIEDESLRAVALNLHASFLYVAGDVHAAVEAIAESLELQPESVNGLVKKGGFLSEIGDMEEAAECFNQAAEIDPNDADVYLHMGQKDLLEGNYYQAVQTLRRSISRSEALPVTHVSYGMALYKSGSVFQAIDVFEDAAKAFPNSPEVHLFYGEVLADQGDYASAMKHFLRGFELSPLCPLPFLNAGRVYVSTNDPMRAIAHFQQALEIDPRCSSAHLDIAQVLFAQGRTTEAFEHFDTAAHCCRFLPEVEEVCAAQEMAKMQERVTDILGVDLRHLMRSK
ncbi:hypothetical protein Poli38472_006305 [Pythium oligandrum]|uniref:Rhodanese domain-containing protein n=1 Tax=Pythium oligandrum TaxID=41045 RepID=A0A8K1FRC0_PYTOL|nr:hypothetical protein Poli38472_006305 [Pythium oligandrum]|eukprot:TMW68837.1 hypothetical protein Poli38472_006305 [Pythium oligandrum]